MNEKGLYIANLNNDYDAVLPNTSDTTKKYVQTTVAIRYILDRAKDVDEALNWLQDIIMCPVYGDMVDENGEPDCYDYHFAIADNSGRSVVVEWVSGVMKYVDTKIVTNHHLAVYDPQEDDWGICDTKGDGYVDDDDFTNNIDENNLYLGSGSEERFIRLWRKKNNEMSVAEVTDALKNVQQKHSTWSAVFEPSAKKVTYYFRKANILEGVQQIPSDTHDYDEDEYPDYYKAVHEPMNYDKPVVVQF